MKRPTVYILHCADDSYYTGLSTQPEERLRQHHLGGISSYTATRRPVRLVWQQEFATIAEAARVERKIKGWTRAKKEALIRGDFDLLHELSVCQNRTHSRFKPSNTTTAPKSSS